jgi:hypothetical protein
MLAGAAQLAGCGDDDHGEDRANGFVLTATVAVGTAIQAAIYQDTTYSSGDTFDIDEKYATYDEATSGSALAISVTNGTGSEDAFITVECGTMYGIPTLETDQYMLDWPAGAAGPSTGGQGMCQTPTMTFGWVE